MKRTIYFSIALLMSAVSSKVQEGKNGINNKDTNNILK